jgi:hypothetical protein
VDLTTTFGNEISIKLKKNKRERKRKEKDIRHKTEI